MESFGCRASQADGDAIAAGLEALGAWLVAGRTDTDVVVVNTCTVTAEADRDARAYIRRVQRGNPRARIVVTGCYAQRAPQEVAALPGVFAVVGNSHKGQVAEIALGGRQDANTRETEAASRTQSIVGNDFVPVSSLQAARGLDASPLPGGPAFVLAGDIFAHSEFQLPSLPASAIERLARKSAVHRTRPTLKIQDGCGNRCTFCVIPSTRGNSRSLPRAQVLESVDDFIEAGGQELVLSGINLGRWGRDLTPQHRLEDLLAEIFETTKLPRLRISSVEPMDWTEGLIALLRRWGQSPHPRLARHAHMPLQSGSDRVLRRMHRRYRPWHYAERLAKVRAASPYAAIGADVIVGFPGETEEEFRETYDFIASQPFTYLHLFPFSARPGTAAWELHRGQPVSGGAVRERMAALRDLIAEKNFSFRSSFVGAELSAVTISDGNAAERHESSAITDNFLPVKLAGNFAPNTLLSAAVNGLTEHGLTGTATSAQFVDPIAIGDPPSWQRATALDSCPSY